MTENINIQLVAYDKTFLDVSWGWLQDNETKTMNGR